MPLRRFWCANILSAVFWAPAYLLPGFIVGAAVTRADTLDKLSEILMIVVVLAVVTGFCVSFAGELLQRRYRSGTALFGVASGLILILMISLNVWTNGWLEQFQLQLENHLSLIQQQDLVEILSALKPADESQVSIGCFVAPVVWMYMAVWPELYSTVASGGCYGMWIDFPACSKRSGRCSANCSGRVKLMAVEFAGSTYAMGYQRFGVRRCTVYLVFDCTGMDPGPAACTGYIDYRFGYELANCSNTVVACG